MTSPSVTDVAARQEWLARQQRINDPELRQRVIAAVDAAIAGAVPGQADVDNDDGVQHTSVWWS